MSDWTNRLVEPTEPTVTWPVRGQERLFDGNDYHQPHTDLGWIPESAMGDDDVHSMMTEDRNLTADTEHGQLGEWGWSS